LDDEKKRFAADLRPEPFLGISTALLDAEEALLLVTDAVGGPPAGDVGAGGAAASGAFLDRTLRSDETARATGTQT
jgi:hypothetical protein